MSLNFGQSLFPPRGELSINYNYTDILRGTAYDVFYPSKADGKKTTYESYTTNDDEEELVSGTSERAAQTFTVGNTGTDEDFWVTDVELYGNLETDDGIMIIQIQGVDGAGKPDGVIIAEGQYTNPNLSYGIGWIRFTLNLVNGKLSSGTQYALIVGYINSATNSLQWRRDGTSPTYTGGQAGTSADIGATWTMDSTADFLFKIIGSTENPMILSTEQSVNQGSITFQETAAETWRNRLDIDIDTLIGTTTTLQGEALITIAATVSGNDSLYFEFELMRVTNGSETSLGTCTTNTSYQGSTTHTGNILISDKEILKNGDVLRLAVRPYWKDTKALGTFTFALNWSNLTIHLPFRITQ